MVSYGLFESGLRTNRSSSQIATKTMERICHVFILLVFMSLTIADSEMPPAPPPLPLSSNDPFNGKELSKY